MAYVQNSKLGLGYVLRIYAILSVLFQYRAKFYASIHEHGIHAS